MSLPKKIEPLGRRWQRRPNRQMQNNPSKQPRHAHHAEWSYRKACRMAHASVVAAYSNRKNRVNNTVHITYVSNELWERSVGAFW